MSDYGGPAVASDGGDQSYGDGVNQDAVKASTPNTRKAVKPSRSTPSSPAPAVLAPAMPAPGELGPLTAPTDRPNEDVLAGLGTARTVMGAATPELDELRALFRRYPSEDLRRVIEQAERSL